MKATIKKRLQQVVDGQRQLPAQSYRDAGYQKVEIRSVYENGWMAIGYASDYSQSNTAHALTVLGHPILITRDNDYQLHIFANVCRHRGHLLLDTSHRNRKILTCPYHAWCYSLDGKFVKAPYWDGSPDSEPDKKQKSALALLTIRFAVWYDIIFVNLSGCAEPRNRTSLLQQKILRYTEQLEAGG